MGRTNGKHTRLLLRNLQGRICILRRKSLYLREQKPERRDVNLQVQEGSKEVGEGNYTNKAGELMPKAKKRRGKSRPSK